MQQDGPPGMDELAHVGVGQRESTRAPLRLPRFIQSSHLGRQKLIPRVSHLNAARTLECPTRTWINSLLQPASYPTSSTRPLCPFSSTSNLPFSPWHPFLSSPSSPSSSNWPSGLMLLSPIPSPRLRRLSLVSGAGRKADPSLYCRHSLARRHPRLPYRTRGRLRVRSSPAAVLPGRGLRCTIPPLSSRH